jgi:hypothetical protein
MPLARKASLEQLVGILTSACGPKMVSDLRSQRMGRGAQLGLILAQAPKLFISNEPFRIGEAQMMVHSGSLLIRFYYLRLRHALWWLARGGLATAKPSTVLNHRFDQEYILIGSFFDETFTRDNDASEADMDLRALLDASQAGGFLQAYAEYMPKTGADHARPDE